MSEHSSFGFSDLAKQASLQPKEALLDVSSPHKALFIGVPKETTLQENRISLTPSSVQLLVNSGNEVWIESNAGKAAKFSDKEYSEAGARICYDQKELYKADIIVKVEPPTPAEVELLKPEQLLISALQHGGKSEPYVRSLMQKKINAIGFEFLRDASGMFPIIRSLSEIAGITTISLASDLLSARGGGKGEMLGGVAGIPPTEIVIIGAGTVGEFAARAALGKGATVKVFDHSLSRLRRLQTQLGQSIYTSLIHPKILHKALLSADVAIGCIRSDEGRSPVLVSEAWVSEMKEMSVIIDVSIDQGGVFETSEVTTHAAPTYVRHGVIHYCVPNITSNVCRTASYALSNVITPLLMRITESKTFADFLFANPDVRNGVYIYKGHLTEPHLGKRLSIYQKDLELLLAAHA